MRIMTKGSLLRQLSLLVGVTLLISLIFSLSVRAVSRITESYIIDGNATIGSLVSISTESANKVIAATNETAKNLLGIIVNPEDSALSLTSGKDNSASVATSGTYPVLVSDINGEIEPGDPITASQIEGIGMLASTNTRIVGTAQTAMTSKSQQTYKDTDGTEKTITIGEVEVLVNVSSFYKESEKTLIPEALQQLANSIAGKKVDPVPIILGAGIFLITLIVVTSIIFSMVKNSIISVGRNPMAQSAVYRNVIQLSTLVLGLLAVGALAIYLILTKL